MEERAKTAFKWKFWYLTIMLNVVILFYALVFIFLLIIPDPYKVPGAILFLIAAIIMTIATRRTYVKTKEWLDQNTES